MGDSEALTPTQVAERLGMSESRVRALLREGRLAGERTVDGWRVPSSALGPIMAGREKEPSVREVLRSIESRLSAIESRLDDLAGPG